MSLQCSADDKFDDDGDDYMGNHCVGTTTAAACSADSHWRIQKFVLGGLVGVEFNAPLDTTEVISEAVFAANHLTDTDKQNSLYR